MAVSRNDQDQTLDGLRRRARYRASHRGTRELDWLLGRFADAETPKMDGAELMEFEEFLSLPDPDIENWLLTPDSPAPDGMAGDFIARLKRFHEF